MIYTISNNYITFEEDQKRNYPNGGKFKTNAEERQDEESYHLKPNKKQKKGGALSSTLAVKDMSSALTQGGAEEDEDEDEDEDVDEGLTEDEKYYKNITNVNNNTLSELHQIAEKVGLQDYKKMAITKLRKALRNEVKPIRDEITIKQNKIRLEKYHKKASNFL